MEGIILVDADIVIDYFNGLAPMADAVEALIKRGALGIPSISVFELYAGIEGRKRLAAVKALLKNSLILPLDGLAAYQAARIYTILKREGRLIGNQDLLIAGIAISNNLPLLTRNIDRFQRIKGIRIISPEQV